MSKLDANELIRAGCNASQEQRIMFLNVILYEQRSLLMRRLIGLNFNAVEALEFLEIGGLTVWDALVKPLDVPREGGALAEYNRAVLKRINAAGLAERIGVNTAQCIEGLLVLVPVLVAAFTERLEADAARRSRAEAASSPAAKRATTASDNESES